MPDVQNAPLEKAIGMKSIMNPGPGDMACRLRIC